MNNTKFTASEQNKLQKDIEKVARDAKWEYPVAMTLSQGVDATTLLEVKEVGNPEFMEHGKADGKLHFKACVRNYEFVNRNGETKRFRMPDAEGMTTEQLYSMTASMVKFTEILRKFVNVQTMTNRDVVSACPEGAGVVLADKLLGLPGINTTMEATLRNVWARSGSTQSFNAFMNDHSADRAVVELKDKFIAASSEQYAEACKGIAAALAKSGNTQVVAAPATTGVTPTIVAPVNASVNEITNIREAKKTLKNIL